MLYEMIDQDHSTQNEEPSQHLLTALFHNSVVIVLCQGYIELIGVELHLNVGYDFTYR